MLRDKVLDVAGAAGGDMGAAQREMVQQRGEAIRNRAPLVCCAGVVDDGSPSGPASFETLAGRAPQDDGVLNAFAYQRHPEERFRRQPERVSKDAKRLAITKTTPP